ncbi:MAG: metallophosphoesterase [Candidatus Dormibacteraceae bacterium]
MEIVRLALSVRTTAIYAMVFLAAACSGGIPTSASRSSPAGTASPASSGSSASSGAGTAGATPTTVGADGIVSWVHIGDLHIQTADMQNYKDLQTILGEINQDFAGGVNFAVLPGDNANEGSDAEYQLIGQAIKAAALKIPLYAVKGDHDEKSTTQAFQQYLYPKTYYSADVNGYHFIFLEAMTSSGDNSLTPGSAEWTWFSSDLKGASAAGKQSVIVMHPYFLSQLPDLTDFQTLVQQNHVVMIDSGHTHTNDLANDGHIIYAATRSTGQISEGAVGVSVSTIDHGIVSWKFAPLGQFPFVEITSPGDGPLITSAAGIAHGNQTIDAKAFSTSSIASASYQIDGGTSISMTGRSADMWTAAWDTTTVGKGEHKITVTVKDQAGKTATDSILAQVDQSDTYSPGTRSFGPATNLLLATNPDIAAKGIVVTTASNGGGAPKGAPGAGGPKGGGPGGASKTATITGISGNKLTLKLANGTTTTVVLGSGVQLIKETLASTSDISTGTSVQLVGPPGAPTQIVILLGSSQKAASASSKGWLGLGGLILLVLVALGLAGAALLGRRRGMS